MREAGASVIEDLYGVVDREFLAAEVYRTMAALETLSLEQVEESSSEDDTEQQPS
jgi:hypothetical protein